MKKVESQKTTLILAQGQLDRLTELLEDNEYKTFLYQHLIPIKYELQRQLSNLTNTSLHTKIKE
tara:strand:- start:338 stop:529 length:192 start_codon:yes stop_codon:yes gene_type:complete